MADCSSSRGDGCRASPELEEASLVKRYGGLQPKKKPLISKDHARAFFDSADWALWKQGAGANQSSKVPVEILRPKLEDAASAATPSEAVVHVGPGYLGRTVGSTSTNRKSTNHQKEKKVSE